MVKVLYTVSSTICFHLFVVLYACLSAHIFESSIQNYSWYMFGHRLMEDVGYPIAVTLFTVNFYSFCCTVSKAN